jgi:PAS domain S-box-containing protein
MEDGKWLFSATNISKTYGSQKALDGVDFGVRHNEVVGLLGENGAGKSTLVKVISGVVLPDAATYFMDDQPCAITCRADSEKAGIETIYQDGALCDNLSITRNIFMGRELVGAGGFLDHATMRKTALQVIDAAVHILGLENPDKEVGKLSGGQKQAVAIARAIHFKSRILVLDEPTSALSVRESERLLGYLVKLRNDGVSCVLVTHNLYQAWQVCDRFVVMSRGRKIGDVNKANTSLEEILGLLGLTERKQAERAARLGAEALRESEARIRRLVDANIIGIFIWDFDGHILEANDAFLRIVGYDRDDLVAGRVRWTDLTPPEWQEADARVIEETKMTGRSPPFEKEYFRKDGSRVPLLIGVATFEEGGNQGVAFVLDLTERKQAEKNLQRSERRYREAQMELAHVNRVITMGQLTASIAHEVNQPIAAAITSADGGLRWLAAQPPDLEEVRDAFDRIIKAGNQAGEVIRRIRTLVRKVPERKASFDVNEAILETIDLTRSEMRGHRILLQTELAHGMPHIWGDRVQLQQVILNLIVNAIEAMQAITDRPRELAIGSYQDDARQAVVTVRDCGVGISAEDAERLFNAFFTTKSSGMGMGLSICRSIIEAHGGRVWGEPNLPWGASFHFTLPLHQEDGS